MFSPPVAQKIFLRTLFVLTTGSSRQLSNPCFYEYFPQVDLGAIVFIYPFTRGKGETKAPAHLQPLDVDLDNISMKVRELCSALTWQEDP